MKKLSVLTLVFILLTFSAASTVATYPGEMEEQGPEAVFTVGYASDSAAEIELEVLDKEGLNVTHVEKYSFVPDEESKMVQRGDETLPLKEFEIQVESVNPSQRVYSIPVSLTAYTNSNQRGRTTPRVVQERQYTFTYHTEASNSFDGSLLDPGREEEEPDSQRNETGKESSLTNQSQENTGSRESEEEGGSINMVLVFSVVLVFGYTVYEAIT